MNITPNTVRNKIDEFNAFGNGFHIVIPGYGVQVEGSLNSEIYYKGVLIGSITYKRITE
jgi:hypothetical protein